MENMATTMMIIGRGRGARCGMWSNLQLMKYISFEECLCW